MDRGQSRLTVGPGKDGDGTPGLDKSEWRRDANFTRGRSGDVAPVRLGGKARLKEDDEEG